MKILLDFDDVLFDTGKFVEDLKNVFERHGISREEYDFFRNKFYEECFVDKKPRFDIWKYVDFIERERKLDRKKIDDELGLLTRNLKKYVFDDAVSFLKSNNKNRLTMVTFGDTNFQQLKIDKSEIKEFFGEIFVAEGDKSEVLGRVIDNDSHVFFIDDRVENIEDVKKNFDSVHTILMRRSEGRYCDEPNECCDFVVKDFSEARKIIESVNSDQGIGV